MQISKSFGKYGLKVFPKKTGSRVSVTETLAEELATEAFKRGRVYARFKDNIWAADLD